VQGTFSSISVSAGQGRTILLGDDPSALTDRTSKGIEMNRGLVVAVGAAALVVASLSGCSSSGTTSTSEANTKVTLDGQDQPITGSVTCVTQGGNLSIAVGDPSKAITATLTSGDSPDVQSVSMGSSNGVALVYTKGIPGGGEATASKDGSTYKISGKVTGLDASQPGTVLTKPFEMNVTCP
jgi:lipoprotein LpqH